VCTDPGYQEAPELVPSGVGGAIVAWVDARSGNNIYAQRLNASGVGQWIPNGVAVCTPGNAIVYAQYPGIAPDGAGGAFLTWTNLVYNGIFAQQVNFNGLVQWGPNGAVLSTASGERRRPTIAYFPQGGTGAVVTWQDQRNEPLHVYDIYALPVPNTTIDPLVKLVPYPNGIIIAPDPHIWPVHLLFNNVIAAGFTYLDITPAGPSLPPSFVLGDGRYYNLSTTAGTTDNIQVCIKFDPAALQHPAAALRMFEYNVAGPAGPTWLDVTTGTAAGDSICGTTTTLSTFVIGWPSVTGVGDTPAPASFAMHPNLPNPFNPITTIRYDVPASGADVNISIYDVSGRLIRSLVKEHRGAGEWSVQWNGENDRGQSVASGVYFYRMLAGEFVDTRKMILLK
jgi:FlgD Ig-like domain